MKRGLCKCGCGMRTGLAKQTLKSAGWIKGEPLNYIRGHYKPKQRVHRNPNPSGMCMCGCGEKTPVASRTDRGASKGNHVRYIPGHHRRKSHGVAPEGYEIDDVSGCWVWRLRIDKRGYGRTSVNGVSMFSHRAMWEKFHGPIPPGLEIDHVCRNTACCNPAHLELVTPTENKRRSRATKLTESQVKEIKESAEKQCVLAERFGVDPSNIFHIIRGDSWADIEIKA